MSGTQEQTPDGPREFQGDLGHDPYGHGQSTAAWAAVVIIVVGAFVMGMAVIIPTLWLFIVGCVIVVAGGIAGKVLGALGFGANAPGVR